MGYFCLVGIDINKMGRIKEYSIYIKIFIAITGLIFNGCSLMNVRRNFCQGVLNDQLVATHNPYCFYLPEDMNSESITVADIMNYSADIKAAPKDVKERLISHYSYCLELKIDNLPPVYCFAVTQNEFAVASYTTDVCVKLIPGKERLNSVNLHIVEIDKANEYFAPIKISHEELKKLCIDESASDEIKFRLPYNATKRPVEWYFVLEDDKMQADTSNVYKLRLKFIQLPDEFIPYEPIVEELDDFKLPIEERYEEDNHARIIDAGRITGR